MGVLVFDNIVHGGQIAFPARPLGRHGLVRLARTQASRTISTGLPKSTANSSRALPFGRVVCLVEGSQGNGSGFRRSARMLCALQIAVNAEALAPSAVR